MNRTADSRNRLRITASPLRATVELSMDFSVNHEAQTQTSIKPRIKAWMQHLLKPLSCVRDFPGPGTRGLCPSPGTQGHCRGYFGLTRGEVTTAVVLCGQSRSHSQPPFIHSKAFPLARYSSFLYHPPTILQGWEEWLLEDI